jgi:hypothetical protein
MAPAIHAEPLGSGGARRGDTLMAPTTGAKALGTGEATR